MGGSNTLFQVCSTSFKDMERLNLLKHSLFHVFYMFHVLYTRV